MIDGHVHLERGEYSKDWVDRFVGYALEMGISEIYLLEHSHRFKEFSPVYEGVIQYSEYQRDWLSRKMCLDLDDYKGFITKLRKNTFPIKVRFGLEVCYIEDFADVIGDIVDGFDWDFLTGSVHWIDGWGFDHRKEFWEGKDVDRSYVRYYEIMASLIRSGLFNVLAHPDSLKCFGHKPAFDLADTYAGIADLLKRYGMLAEQSAGLRINYGRDELGLNREMAAVFAAQGVGILTASDAHRPEDVGRYIREMALWQERPAQEN